MKIDYMGISFSFLFFSIEHTNKKEYTMQFSETDTQQAKRK